MSNHAVITLGFTRTVYAHELQPGDVFTFPDAPTTPLLITSVGKVTVSSELALLRFTLPGPSSQLHLPANTPVRPRRMIRTITLRCLLCKKAEDIELDLPHDGEPLSFVCGKHTPDSEATS
ncbi:hypothetical protein ABZ705_06880 [Streptomyces sp. NPDC006984]|uniref:hypothetical protein n=1 Tax=Streptomyces sp. NPDC006984 TaxID=3155463 RepID=UPI0033F66402